MADAHLVLTQLRQERIDLQIVDIHQQKWLALLLGQGFESPYLHRCKLFQTLRHRFFKVPLADPAKAFAHTIDDRNKRVLIRRG